jgi:ATP-dependent DNA helicase RecG
MPAINLSSPLSSISPPRFVAKLKKLGLETVSDLLYHFPFRYENWGDLAPINTLVPGETRAIRGIVEKIGFRKSWGRYRALVEATLGDGNGRIRAFWFNQPYVKKNLPEGQGAIFYGKILSGKRGLFISNPSYELIKPGQPPLYLSSQKKLLPIYPETRGLTSKSIRQLVEKALAGLGEIPEFLPEEILKKENLPEINRAFRTIHFPETSEEAGRARKRFEFEELFLLQLNNLLQREKISRLKSPTIPFDAGFTGELTAGLPFPLTAGQKKVLEEILTDLSRNRPMNRLLQGDVGSGKTIIAALAALTAAKAGFQTALMAPTEILAEQHYQTFRKFFGQSGFSFCLLTAKSDRIHYPDGLESEIRKTVLLREIKNGKTDIVVGTHSLISRRKNDPLSFLNLGLVVVDEQHRFGVGQRAELSRGGKITPHFLSMSATPIPRTLAITVFGDLDLSLIDGLPAGRKEIITRIVAPENRDKAYAFIRGQIRKGRQAFVICPRIESGENSADSRTDPENCSEIKTVKKEFDRLSSEIFPDLRLGMLHGRLKPEEKRKMMLGFKSGRIDILVSTSVVEVGVDIPNATIMIIEGAERFGLSQLYQFRGRVGRGGHQSFCLLFTGSFSPLISKRLDSLLEARNGFELAEKDLALRGPGEFLGAAQTGFPDIVMSALRNHDLIKKSREAAGKIIEADRDLKSHPRLREKLADFSEETHLE